MLSPLSFSIAIVLYLLLTDFVVNANLFQHGVRSGQRGEDSRSVGGAETSRDPEEKTAHEFRGQDEQNRGLH